MFSNDLFSYLDSAESSSPVGSSLFGECDLLQQQRLELLKADKEEDVTMKQEDMMDSGLVLADLKQERQSSGENPGTHTDQKGTLLNEASEEEDELIQYLTGQKTEFVPPCLKLIPKPKLENSNNFSSVETGSDGQSLCMSKNAIAARETRQRKKQYIGTLENAVRKLRSENVDLKNETKRMKSHISELSEEVCYLKSVLANQSVLAGLLQNIQNTPGVRFQSSLTQNKGVGVQDMQSKKPTATVTGRVKQNPCKRRRNQISCRKSTDEFDNVKRANLDHGYAAEPREVFDDIDVERCETDCVENAVPDDGCLSEKTTSAGICLHVSNGSVSFEFCAECSKKALCL